MLATDEPVLSIGEVADAVGLSVFTLRQWERRYGAPFSHKLSSGHRRYSPLEVRRLKLVKRAMNAGAKPNEYVAAPFSDLETFVRTHGDDHAIRTLTTEQIIESLLAAARRWHTGEFFKILEEQWQICGAISFISEIVAPLLVRIGEDWHKGRETVALEHFISELLCTFLSSRWVESNAKCTGRPFVMSCLPNELHDLGLHICAVAMTSFGRRIIFLGSSTPIDQLIETAKASDAAGVSISKFYPGATAERLLGVIVQKLPKTTPLIVGGSGAPTSQKGTFCFRNFSTLQKWVTDQRSLKSEGARG
jgi:methanogenic corrinoid protein MtbC1